MVCSTTCQTRGHTLIGIIAIAKIDAQSHPFSMCLARCQCNLEKGNGDDNSKRDLFQSLPKWFFWTSCKLPLTLSDQGSRVKNFFAMSFQFFLWFLLFIHSVLSIWSHIKEQCQRLASEFYSEIDFNMNLPIDITRLLFAIGFSLTIKPINKNGTWTVIEIAKHWSESFPNCLVRCIFLVIMWKEFSRIFVSGLWVKLSGLFRCNLFYWATQIDAKFREVFKSKHMDLALGQ